MKHTPNSSHLIQSFEDSLTREIQRLPVVMDHAYGATLVDVDGNEYLDFLSGIGVMSLGYSNARVQKAMQEQITRLIHTSNYFYTEPLLRLSALLCEKSFARAVFFLQFR